MHSIDDPEEREMYRDANDPQDPDDLRLFNPNRKALRLLCCIGVVWLLLGYVVLVIAALMESWK